MKKVIKITIEIEVSNIQSFDVNWKNESGKCRELEQFQTDIKAAIPDSVGIDLNSIKVVKCYLS